MKMSPDELVNIVAFGRQSRSMFTIAEMVRRAIKTQMFNGDMDMAEALRKAYMARVWDPNLKYLAESTSYQAILKSQYALKILDQCAIPSLTKFSDDGYSARMIRPRIARHNSKHNKKPPIK